MAMDFDSQLIESVEVRRHRLSASFLFGRNPTERRWKERTNSFVYGLIIAALICAFCVALSFVINILTNYINDRNEREQEQEQQERARHFAPYQVTPALMDLADEQALFMHCLPAHRGEEISHDMLDDPRSVVWDEAENRLHAQKALLEFLLHGQH